MSEIFVGISTVPGIAALIAALYQLLRDQAAFEKQLHLQKQQQIFNLGASSYMAKIAFEKHAAFCEEYMEEVHETVTMLFRHGPTKKVDRNLQKLFEIRRKYAAWVTKEMGLSLEPFETAISNIASISGLVESLEDSGRTASQNSLDKMYKIFEEVMNFDSQDMIESNKEITVEEVKAKIRAIIGVEELSEIRSRIINSSLEYLQKNA